MTLAKRLSKQAAPPPQRLVMFLAAVLGLLALAAAVVYLSPRPRSFAVDAQTRAVTFSFLGNSMNGWRLPGALVCLRKEVRSVASGDTAPDDAALCDPRLYELLRLGDIEMTWPDGTVVVLLRTGTGPVEILVSEIGASAPEVDGIALSRSSRIVVTDRGSLDNLILPFSATITIGGVPGPGSQDALISGTFEVREAMPTQERHVPLMTGPLFPGDQVRIVGDDTSNEASSNIDIPVYGFAVPRGIEPGLQVAAYTPPSRSALRLDRFAADPIFTVPTWIDRLVHDPILIGITAAAGIVGGLAGALNGILDLLRRPATASPREERPTADNRAPAPVRRPRKGR